MMAFQALVVSQDLCWREEKCDSPQFAITVVAIEQHRRQTDPISAQQPPRCSVTAGFLGPHQDVPSPRLQGLDLGKHSIHQPRVPGREGDDDRLRILAENAEDDFLERRPQRNSMDTASPAVRCFASGWAIYSTNTFCGGF